MNHHGTQNPEEVVNEFIASFGVTGVPQAKIVNRIKPAMTAMELTIYLNQLRDERKVDRYEVPGFKGGRPAIWWRATTKMIED